MEATQALTFSEKRRELARTGLGGSDAAAVLGLSRYKTPLECWMDATGRSVDEGRSEAAEWGTRLEPEVLRRYAEDLPYPEVLIGRDRHGDMAWYGRQEYGTVEIVPLQNGNPARARFGHLFGTLRHPDLPHLMMHLDGIVIDCETDEVLRLVDAKTAGHWAAKDWGEEGTDEAPYAYIVQAHHYAGILDLNGYPVPVCDIPALFAGQSYRLYPVTISVTLYRSVHEKLGAWWNAHVVTDIPPEPKAADNRLMGSLYPEDSGESVFAPDELSDFARALGEYRDMEKEAKEGRAGCEAKIKAAIGEASEIVGEGWRCTWKKSADSEKTDYEAAFKALRAAIGLRQDHALIEAAEEALADATETKPGSRRMLAYGLAKTTEVDK